MPLTDAAAAVNGIQEVSGSIPLISTKTVETGVFQRFFSYFGGKTYTLFYHFLRKTAETLDNIYIYIYNWMYEKGTHITQQEKMPPLYKQLGGYTNGAKKLHRSSDTVSRYVREHEAAVNTVRVVMDAQNT